MSLTADQLRGKARVLIDGEEKFLRFDQNALSRLIDALGIESLASLPSAVTNLDPATLNILVWAGRLWEEPDLKREDIGALFFALMPTYQSAIEALNLALWGMPEPEIGGSEDDADPPEAERNGTSEPREPLQ